MSATQGPIPGETPLARATAVAGLLAELGQMRLTLRVFGADVELQARVTNLPGTLVEEVVRSGSAHLEAPALGASFTITKDGGTWECAEPHAAAQLRARLK